MIRRLTRLYSGVPSLESSYPTSRPLTKEEIEKAKLVQLTGNKRYERNSNGAIVVSTRISLDTMNFS